MMARMNNSYDVSAIAEHVKGMARHIIRLDSRSNRMTSFVKYIMPVESLSCSAGSLHISSPTSGQGESTPTPTTPAALVVDGKP